MTSIGLRSLGALGAALDRDRVLAYCRILLAVETAVFLFVVAGTHGLIVPLAGPTRPTSSASMQREPWPIPARRNSPTTRPPMTPPNSAPRRPASSTGSSITRRFSCCCAPRSPICPTWRPFVVFEAATLALCLIVMRRDLRRGGLVGDPPGIGVPARLLGARSGAEFVSDRSVVRRRHVVDRPPADRLPGCVSERSATSRISPSSSRWRCLPGAIGALSARRSDRR